MLFLVLSLLPLALGPLLVDWAKRARWTAVWLDAFVIITVGGMVLLHILPESLNRGGLWTLAAFLIGLFGPVLAEQGLTPTGKGTRTVALGIALLALLFHSMLDGVGLQGEGLHQGGEHGTGEILVWAVLLHRVLEGIGIWWVVPRTLGVTVAIIATLVLAAGTVLGFSLGGVIFEHMPGKAIALFEALLCGSLAHIVVHAHIPPPREPESGRLHWASVIGGLVGVAATVALTMSHSHAHGETVVHDDHVHGPGATFLNLALQSAPALVFGYFAVGLSQSFLPADWAKRIMGGSVLTQALRGIAVGLPLPVCSCGVLPIYRDLVKKGASLAGGIAFLIATPELEIAAILLSFTLLGPEIAIARIACAGLLALLTALIVQRVARRRGESAPTPATSEAAPPRRSLTGALRYGFVNAVEDTGSWLLAGLGLAAILTPYLNPELLRSLPSWLDVPIAALLGLPLYVCASGSTPLAAVLMVQGVSPGAAIAFLLTGPATNITTYGVLSSLHGRRVAVTFALCMLVLSTGLGYAVNALLPPSARAVAVDPHHHQASWLEIACLTVVGLALLFFFLRVGVRGVLARLFMAHADDHAADHAGHDHAAHGAHDHAHACCKD